MKKLTLIIISTFLVILPIFTSNLYASGYSEHMGFVTSGAVNPPQLYPSTFGALHTKWITTYSPNIWVGGIPLANKGNPNGYYHLANLSHGGEGEHLINITPWTQPTWFRVFSRGQIESFVADNGRGSYYLIGSEPNVLTVPLRFAGQFESNQFWKAETFWNWAIPGGGNYRYDTSTSTQADTSLLVEANTSGQNWVKSFQIHDTRPPIKSIEGNKTYRVEVDIKTENVWAGESWQGAGLHIYENGVWPGSANGGGKTPMLLGTNDWQRYSFDFTTQPNTAYLEIFVGLGFGGNATGKVWFDNITVSEVEGSTAVSDKQIYGSVSGDYFAPIFKYYSETLKSVDPTAKIVGPNFLTFSDLPDGEENGVYGLYYPGREWFDAFLARYRSLYNSDPNYDVYATHVYDNLRLWNLQNYLDHAQRNISEFRSYIDSKFGSGKTVWITEFGVQTPGVADDQVADFLEQMHQYLINRGDIDKWFWAWSYAPSHYPFSGYLFEDNSDGASLTSVGEKFANLALEDVTVLKQGDANGDGKVDGLDYIIWLNNYNQTTSNGVSDGDFNQDGTVNGLDYVVWLNNYGS